MAEHIFYLLLGVLGLYAGAEWLVRGGTAVAYRLNISPLVIGLTIIGYGTCSPELIVSAQAAWNGDGDLSIGNVIGSNICNIGLITGLTAIARPIAIQARLVKVEIPIMLLSSLIFLRFLWGYPVITRLHGLVLCVSLVVYTVWLIRNAWKENGVMAEECSEVEKSLTKSMWIEIGMIIGGLAVLLWGGDIFLKGIYYLGKVFHISEAVLGLTVVSLSTSLPELATSLVAIKHSNPDIAIGNIIGSNIYNILAIIGVSSLITPLPFLGFTLIDVGMLIFLSFAMAGMMYWKNRIGRLDGVFLLACYIGYMAYLVSTVTF